MADYGIKVMPYGATSPQTELSDLGTISNFRQKSPEPKVIKVDIPAGPDLDLTSALGPVGWHNGEHSFDLYIVAETEAQCVQTMRDLAALVHGKQLRYILSWQPGYYCQGRWTVEFERLNPRAARAMVTIDREPWRQGYVRETHVIDCHPDGSFKLEGSARFHTVRVKLLQGGEAEVAAAEPGIMTHRDAGTHTLAADAYAGDTVWLAVSDWLMYVDGDDLKVNPSRFELSGTNAVIDGSYTDAQGATVTDHGTVVDGDLRFALCDLQKVTVDFYRWDL